MKKLLLFSSVLVLQINLFGQAVPNGAFENWNSTAYDDPDGFNTANLHDIQHMGTATITQVTGYAGKGIRIQTNANSTDTSESYIINMADPCSDPSQWRGGQPFSGQATAITGYYRYNLPGNDSALMIVIFLKNGAHIGDNFIRIRGTGSQSTWASFSFPVTCAGTPDSMIFAAASSNKLSNVGVQNGSFLELDNLGFAGTTQAFPNGTFENWTAKSYDQPASWLAWGNGVSKTTDSYSGTYAIRLETIDNSCGEVNSSGITTGTMTDNNGPAGGRPYTQTSDTLCGYYKYTAMGNDTATIYVNLSKNGSPIGGNNKWLFAASTYTYFELPFQSGSAPDTLRVDIQSSQWPVSAANVGSVLYVDNLYLKSSPLGIPEKLKPESRIFPNPVQDVLSIQLRENIPGDATVVIYDETGRQAGTGAVQRNANVFSVDVSGLSSGMYFYTIRTGKGTARNRFMKE